MQHGWYKLNEDKTTELLPPGTYPNFEEDRHIGDDTINGARISTVFLGLDHNWGDGPPVLFETMVFGGEHDEWMDRYHTYDEALAGHKKVVDCITNNKPLEP